VNELLNGTDIGRSTIVDTARLFIEGERRHMQREEEFFFPLAEKMLTAADWSHIEGELAKRPDPLFGERVETRYKLLRERLLAWEQEYPSDRDL
jgi:hemerythrin-like domain-containing protein